MFEINSRQIKALIHVGEKSEMLTLRDGLNVLIRPDRVDLVESSGEPGNGAIIGSISRRARALSVVTNVTSVAVG